MNFKLAKNTTMAVTCFQSNFFATYNQIVKLFGKPNCKPSLKTKCEWNFRADNGRVVTLYDYCSMINPANDPEERFEWNVGGEAKIDALDFTAWLTDKLAGIEDDNREVKFVPTADSKNIPEEILEVVYAEADVNVIPLNNETAMPWDAGFEIRDGQFVISGGLDACGYGHCEVKLPVADVEQYYYIVANITEDDFDRGEFVEILQDHGWKILN